MKIYTKAGDNGSSSVFGGEKTSKSDKIFEALGTLDELNSTLGYVHGFKQRDIRMICIQIQSDLFEMGAFIAGRKFSKENEKAWVVKTAWVEKNIDSIESKLTPLKNFILPGGTLLSASLHNSRAVCRRFERSLVRQSTSKPFISLFMRYVNRLSDLLFVMARYANKKSKVKDIIWKG